MYPLTHFLLPFLISSVLEIFNVVDFQTTLIISILAVAIDLDHLIAHYRNHKELSIKNTWNNQFVHKTENQRSPIHRPVGFKAVTALAAAVLIIHPTTALIITIAYYTHYFLDHFNFHIKSSKLQLKVFGFMTHISITEIALDIILILLATVTSPVIRTTLTIIF
ncbi:hypothetical protein HN419_02495 [Candidatus Woesearchaeota archaeon]|nr:hypothetical protein [Candidatus Woesearchaeota archaeon]MBT3537134.1 hypothetical protein [Candidatus Woesearchaeota archaeon]MBT4697739.1 hypothetical protein [Candidatus Woesearchaeota archaeon]MBT4716556.1 hypothetical protein [Candidatus Woesearchaeota archaeon]MBT7106556.1 hypothetical protein [Candidatus Woesearchaeota archaeon]